MKFRNKILVSICAIVLALLTMTFVVLNYGMRIQIESRFSEDLHGNYSTINEISLLRRAQDIKTCQVIGETPRLKAVAELRDSNTALQLSQELNRSIAADLFILVDEKGNPLVDLLGGVVSHIHPSELKSMLPSVAGRPAADVVRLGNDVFRTASSPIIIGEDNVGSVIIGFKMVHNDIEFLKTLVNAEVALIVGDTLITSSLSSEEEGDLSRAIGTQRSPDVSHDNQPTVWTINASQERYKAAIYRLNQDSRDVRSTISYLLLKPVDKEVKAVLSPMLNTYFIGSIVVLLVAAGIGYFISKGITKPIAVLVQGTREISRGNYDYQMDIRTGGELRFLAQKFEEMSLSLKEKIFQLAQRNVELEHALTQLKETEQELVKSERLAATGKLTAQLSHEINNPIHNIQSCLQTALQRSAPSAPHRELLEVAIEEIERLSKLTHQMLDFYRSSMVQEELQPLNINDLVSEVILSSAGLLREGNIEVQTNLDQRIGAIDGSRDKLKQVFLNLFINAKDAMPDGGVLKVETKGENTHVLVHVSDTGVGIPQENISKIYDAFFTTKKSVSGVGLGLSVTYGIVKQSNGTIGVISNVGKGTTFTLKFPLSSTLSKTQ